MNRPRLWMCFGVILTLPWLWGFRAEIGMHSQERCLPFQFLGAYNGQVTQYNYGNYPMQMSLSSLRKKKLSGSIHYPSLKCGGTLQFLSKNRCQVSLRERITYGNCIDKGIITLKRRASSSPVARWSWYHPNGKLWAVARIRQK